LLFDYDPKKGVNYDRITEELHSQATKSFREKLDSVIDAKSKVTGKGSATSQPEWNWDIFIKQND